MIAVRVNQNSKLVGRKAKTASWKPLYYKVLISWGELQSWVIIVHHYERPLSHSMSLFIDSISFMFLGDLVPLFCTVSFTLHGCISYLFLHFYTSFFLSVSLGVGVNGTAFPAGTVKSLTRGSSQTQTSKWRVSSSSLPIRPEPVSGGWFVPSSPPLLGWGSPLRTHKPELEGLG